MSPFASIFLSISLFLLSTGVQAGLMLFTDESLWRDALTGSLVRSDTFDWPEIHLSGDSTLDRGFFSLSLHGGMTDFGPTGLNGAGFLEAEVDNDHDPLSLSFGFAGASGFALIGFQNDSTSTPYNLSLDEIYLRVQGQNFVLSDIAGTNSSSLPFVGFVASDPLTGFDILHASELSKMTRLSEEFFISEFRLAQVRELPLPSVLWLLVTGIFLISGRAGYRRSHYRGRSLT